MFILINNLYSAISELFFSRTLQNTGVVFAGNIIASGFSLIILLILSRVLGPEIFGVLSLINSITLLLVSLTDLGIAVGLSKFVAPLDNKSSDKALSFFRTVFWIEVLLGLTTILVGIILSDPISKWVGSGEIIKAPLILGFIIAGLFSFNAYITMVLQVLQKFWTLTIFNIFSNLFKLTLILILFGAGYLTLWNSLYINFFTAITILIVGLLIIPRFFTSKIEWSQDINSVKKLFSFTKWLAISYGLSAVATRIDILILSHFRGSAELGQYALAFQLSSALPLLLGAVSMVIIPKVSSFSTQVQLRGYIIKIIRSSIFIIPFTLIAVFISSFIIRLLFGVKFISSIPILQILLLNYSLTLIVNPLSYIMYALNKPRVLTFMNTGTIIILFILHLTLIPRFGGVGAALALLLNTILTIFILIALIILLYKQGKIKI